MNKNLNEIFSFIKRIFAGLKYEAKKNIPVAIDVVEAIKKVLDSQVDDIVLSILGSLVPNLPVSQINIIKSKLEKELPKIILELNLVNLALNGQDINTQLQTILDQLKLSSDDIKAEKYHVMASKILVVLSDGKVTWGEAVMLTEWYYQNYIKK